MLASSQPVLDVSFLPLLLKLFGGLAVITLGLLGRKKIYEMLAKEQEFNLQNTLATNQKKENQAENNVIQLTQKKQDLQQQIKDIDQKVQQTPSDTQILDFFTAEQVQINESKTK